MGRGMVMSGPKARDIRGTMRKLLSYLRAYRLALIIAVVFAIASTVFSVIGPKIMGKATTKLFEGVIAQLSGSGAGIDFAYIGNIVLLMSVLYVVAAVFAYIQGWIMAGVSMNISYQFRKDISEKINRMPLRYFDGTNHGEVLSRVTNDVDTVSQTLSQSLSQVITSVVSVVGVTIMMLSISWVLSLVAFVIIPVSLGLMALVIGQSQKYFKQQQDYLGHVNGHIEEMYTGHLVVRAFNGEAKSVKKFDTFNNELYGSAWKSQFLSGLLFPIMTFVGNLGYVAVAIIGGALAVRGSITIGDIQAFIQYVRQFTQPITADRPGLQHFPADGRGRRTGLRIPGRGRRKWPTATPCHSRRPRSRATWSSITSTSATTRTKSLSTTSRPTSSRASGLPSLARQAPARPPW